MRKASISDIKEISEMLYAMYNEVQPDNASKDINKYKELAFNHIEKDFTFIDEENRAFFVMRDISIPVLNKKTYDGVSVYIKPEFRKSNVLNNMYDFMFKEFNDGSIVGMTDANSEHNKVLIKRYKLVGYLYELS